MTLWAQVAPPRNQQHYLRNAPVPLISLKESLLDSKIVRELQSAVLGANGKEVSPAQSRALSRRTVPADCKLIDIPKDGACLYRAIAQGLTWLSGKKKTEHCHRDLRARANTHLQRHKEQYVAEWDGRGPALEKLEEESSSKAEGFDKYLDLAEKESAYGSVLEIKVLSRIYDVCLMAIPRDGNFATMTFKEAKAKKHRAIVLWYTPKHVDLVMPAKDDEHYPEALFTGSTGQVIDLRAGGRDSKTSDDDASVWTLAVNAPSSRADLTGNQGRQHPDASNRRSADTSPVLWLRPCGPTSEHRCCGRSQRCCR